MHLGEGAAKKGHDPVCAPLPGREMSPAWGYQGGTASSLTKGCLWAQSTQGAELEAGSRNERELIAQFQAWMGFLGKGKEPSLYH